MRRDKIVTILAATILLSGCSPVSSNNTITEDTATENATIGKTLANEYRPELASVFNSPWPTNVSRKDLINSALYKSFEYFDAERVSSCKYSASVYAGEPMLDEHRSLLLGVTEGIVSLFCNHLSKDFYVIGGGYDFVESAIKDNQIPDRFFKGCQRPENEWASACAYSNVAWIGIGLGSKRNGEIFLEDRRLTIAAHEMFHIVHDQIDPDSDGQTRPRGAEFFRPVWLIEGGGEYFGRLIPFYLGYLDNYDSFAPTDRSGQFLSVDYLGDLALMEEPRSLAFGTENYYAGQVALEYIIASVGMDSLINIWVEMGKGKTFDKAFELSTGISVKTFYKKFAEMHRNLYSGDLVTN